jgi:hypothetical protein
MDYFKFICKLGKMFSELGTLVNLSNNKTPNITPQCISQLNRDNRTEGPQSSDCSWRGWGVGHWYAGWGGGWGVGGRGVGGGG